MPETSTVPFLIYFKVRLSTGDVEVVGNQDDKILNIKQNLAEQLDSPPSPDYIRLIYRGKLLKDTDSFDIFPSVDADFGSPEFPIVLHGLISDHVPNQEEQQSPQIAPLMGFDRLREAGFSEQDVQQLRAQFQLLNNIDPNAEDVQGDQTRQLEEAWIDNATQTLPDGSPSGSYYEMAFGMTLGFFLGVIILFWIKEGIFSRRQQVGILTGLVFNFILGFWISFMTQSRFD